MLQRVEVEGIKFPRLYIAENRADAQLALENGIPFIKWNKGKDELIRCLLRPTLEKMFPGIKWSSVLGRRRSVRSNVILASGRQNQDELEAASYDKEAMQAKQYEYDEVVDAYHALIDDGSDTERDVDIAVAQRDCCGDNSGVGYDAFTPDECSVYDYIGDMSSSVDIEALMELGMLPKFIGDIVNCIKINRSNAMRWTEGFTKKRGQCLGNFNSAPQLRNLLIVDISWSIPDGIAATLLTLLETMREMCCADLIITSRRSGFYSYEDKLPDIQTLRDYYGRCNESAEFMSILKKYVAGREYGNVISFGDEDCPGDTKYWNVNMIGTKVHEVWHYHTRSYRSTGYARWVKDCCPDVIEHFNSSWCTFVDRNYKMGAW